MKAIKHVIYVGRELGDGKLVGSAISMKDIKWDKYHDDRDNLRSAYATGMNVVTICQKFTKLLFPDLTKTPTGVEKYEITIRKVK